MIPARAVQTVGKSRISIECCYERDLLPWIKSIINPPKARHRIWRYRSADMCLGIRTFAAQKPARFLLPSGMSHLGTCVMKHLLPTTRRNKHVRNHAVSRFPRPPPRKGA